MPRTTGVHVFSLQCFWCAARQSASRGQPWPSTRGLSFQLREGHLCACALPLTPRAAWPCTASGTSSLGVWMIQSTSPSVTTRRVGEGGTSGSRPVQVGLA